MPTQKETIEFILGKLRDRSRFSARAMFGEYKDEEFELAEKP